MNNQHDKMPWSVFSSHNVEVDSVRETLEEVFGFEIDLECSYFDAMDFCREHRFGSKKDEAEKPADQGNQVEGDIQENQIELQEVFMRAENVVIQRWDEIFFADNTIYRPDFESFVSLDSPETLYNLVMDARFHELVHEYWERDEEPVSVYSLVQGTKGFGSDYNKTFTNRVKENQANRIQRMLCFSTMSDGNKVNYEMLNLLNDCQVNIINLEAKIIESKKGEEDAGVYYAKKALSVLGKETPKGTIDDAVGNYLVRRTTDAYFMAHMAETVSGKALEKIKEGDFDVYLMMMYLIPDDITKKRIFDALYLFVEKEAAKDLEDNWKIHLIELRSIIYFIATLYYPCLSSVFYVLLHRYYPDKNKRHRVLSEYAQKTQLVEEQFELKSKRRGKAQNAADYYLSLVRKELYSQESYSYWDQVTKINNFRQSGSIAKDWAKRKLRDCIMYIKPWWK